jgi:hypothetical protein
MRALRACRRGQPPSPDGDGARATSAPANTQRRLPSPARDEAVAIHLPQRFALEEEKHRPRFPSTDEFGGNPLFQFVGSRNQNPNPIKHLPRKFGGWL